MAGFANGARDENFVRRSLNHRHLDLQLRVPREYLSFEEEIRKMIHSLPGRIELFISRYPERGGRLSKWTKSCWDNTSPRCGGRSEFKISDAPGFRCFPRCRIFFTSAGRADAAERQGLFGASPKLCNSTHPRAEGRQLKADMQAQARHLTRIAVALAARAETPNRFRDPRRRRAVVSRPDDADGSLGIILKGDINEVVRLKPRGGVGGSTSRKRPVGKKIDFMLQEIRES